MSGDGRAEQWLMDLSGPPEEDEENTEAVNPEVISGLYDIFYDYKAPGLTESDGESEPEGDLTNRFIRGAASIPADILKASGTLGTYIDKQLGLVPEDYTADQGSKFGPYAAGQAIEDKIFEMFPINETADPSFPQMLSSGLGNWVSFAGGGIVSKAIGTAGARGTARIAGRDAARAAALESKAAGMVVNPAALRAVGQVASNRVMKKAATAAGYIGVGAMGAGVTAQQLYDDAKANGASEDDSMKAFFLGAGLGTTEAVPIINALNRIDKFLPDGAKTKFLANVAKGAGEEGLQEFLAELGQNVIAKDLVGYDEERGYFVNTKEAAGVGATLGGALNAILGAFGLRRASKRIDNGDDKGNEDGPGDPPGPSDTPQPTGPGEQLIHFALPAPSMQNRPPTPLLEPPIGKVPGEGFTMFEDDAPGIYGEDGFVDLTRLKAATAVALGERQAETGAILDAARKATSLEMADVNDLPGSVRQRLQQEAINTGRELPEFFSRKDLLDNGVTPEQIKQTFREKEEGYKQFSTTPGVDLETLASLDEDAAYNYVGDNFPRLKKWLNGTVEQAETAEARIFANLSNSPFFNRFIGGTEVAYNNGVPRLVYHATTSRNPFDTFLPGTHYGTRGSAEERLGSDITPDNRRVIPGYLNIQNPLQVEDHGGNLAVDYAAELVETGILETADIDRIVDAGGPRFKDAVNRLIDKNGTKTGKIQSMWQRVWNDKRFLQQAYDMYYGDEAGMSRSKSQRNSALAGINQDLQEELFNVLEEKGYDGFTYENMNEDKGAPSYVAFRPEQFKSVFNDRFDPDDAKFSTQPPPTTPKFKATAKVIRQEVEAILNRILPKDKPSIVLRQAIKVDVADNQEALNASGGNLEQGESEIEVAGYYDPTLNLVAIALNKDPRKAAAHEVVHFLMERGFFTVDELSAIADNRDVLVRMATIEQVGQAKWDKLNAKSRTRLLNMYQERLSNEEAFAIAAARYDTLVHQGKDPANVKGVLKTAWAKFNKIMRQIKSSLAGQGFETIESVFESYSTGRVGSRPEGQSDRVDQQVTEALAGVDMAQAGLAPLAAREEKRRKKAVKQPETLRGTNTRKKPALRVDPKTGRKFSVTVESVNEDWDSGIERAFDDPNLKLPSKADGNQWFGSLFEYTKKPKQKQDEADADYRLRIKDQLNKAGEFEPRLMSKIKGLNVNEARWVGLPAWLKSKADDKITKEEILSFTASNTVEVWQTTYSGNDAKFGSYINGDLYGFNYREHVFAYPGSDAPMGTNDAVVYREIGRTQAAVTLHVIQSNKEKKGLLLPPGKALDRQVQDMQHARRFEAITKGIFGNPGPETVAKVLEYIAKKAGFASLGEMASKNRNHADDTNLDLRLKTMADRYITWNMDLLHDLDIGTESISLQDAMWKYYASQKDTVPTFYYTRPAAVAHLEDLNEATEAQQNWFEDFGDLVSGHLMGFADSGSSTTIETKKHKSTKVTTEAGVESEGHLSGGHWGRHSGGMGPFAWSLLEDVQVGDAAAIRIVELQSDELSIGRAQENFEHAFDKNQWPLLVIKNAVQEAVKTEAGYVLWPTGKEINDRWNHVHIEDVTEIDITMFGDEAGIFAVDPKDGQIHQFMGSEDNNFEYTNPYELLHNKDALRGYITDKEAMDRIFTQVAEINKRYIADIEAAKKKFPDVAAQLERDYDTTEYDPAVASALGVNQSNYNIEISLPNPITVADPGFVNLYDKQVANDVRKWLKGIGVTDAQVERGIQPSGSESISVPGVRYPFVQSLTTVHTDTYEMMHDFIAGDIARNILELDTHWEGVGQARRWTDVVSLPGDNLPDNPFVQDLPTRNVANPGDQLRGHIDESGELTEDTLAEIIWEIYGSMQAAAGKPPARSNDYASWDRTVDLSHVQLTELGRQFKDALVANKFDRADVEEGMHDIAFAINKNGLRSRLAADGNAELLHWFADSQADPLGLFDSINGFTQTMNIRPDALLGRFIGKASLVVNDPSNSPAYKSNFATQLEQLTGITGGILDYASNARIDADASAVSGQLPKYPRIAQSILDEVSQRFNDNVKENFGQPLKTKKQGPKVNGLKMSPQIVDAVKQRLTMFSVTPTMTQSLDNTVDDLLGMAMAVEPGAANLPVQYGAQPEMLAEYKQGLAHLETIENDVEKDMYFNRVLSPLEEKLKTQLKDGVQAMLQVPTSRRAFLRGMSAAATWATRFTDLQNTITALKPLDIAPLPQVITPEIAGARAYSAMFARYLQRIARGEKLLSKYIPDVYNEDGVFDRYDVNHSRVLDGWGEARKELRGEELNDAWNAAYYHDIETAQPLHSKALFERYSVDPVITVRDEYERKHPFSKFNKNLPRRINADEIPLGIEQEIYELMSEHNDTVQQPGVVEFDSEANPYYGYDWKSRTAGYKEFDSIANTLTIIGDILTDGGTIHPYGNASELGDEANAINNSVLYASNELELDTALRTAEYHFAWSLEDGRKDPATYNSIMSQFAKAFDYTGEIFQSWEETNKWLREVIWRSAKRLATEDIYEEDFYKSKNASQEDADLSNEEFILKRYLMAQDAYFRSHKPPANAKFSTTGQSIDSEDQSTVDSYNKVFHRDVRSWGQRIRDWIDYFKDYGWLAAKQGFFDQFSSLRQHELEIYGEYLDASISPWRTALLSQNLDSVMNYYFMSGTTIYNPEKGIFEAQEDSTGLLEVFQPLVDADLMDQWAAWMVAKRASRLTKEGRQELLSKEDMDRFLALAEKHSDAVSFEDIDAEWQKFNKSVLNMAESAGIIDAESRPSWEATDYVPFYRVMEDEFRQNILKKGPNAGKGLANQKSGMWALYGGTDKQVDPFEGIVMNLSKLVDASYKNVAMIKVAEMLEGTETITEQNSRAFTRAQVPVGEMKKALRKLGFDVSRTGVPGANSLIENVAALTKPKGDNVISVMVGGKPKYYKVNDALTLQALTGMDYTLPGFISTAANMKTLFTNMVTHDPGFMLANIFRDTVSTFVVTGKTSLRDVIAGVHEGYTGGENLDAIVAAGGGGFGFYKTAPASARGNIKRLHTEGRKATVVESILSSPKRAWRFLERLGRATEMANRIAIRKHVLKNGGTEAEAAAQAQDVLNFSMRGSHEAVRWLTATIPFVNARMQGLYRLGRGAHEDPGGFFLRGAAITAATAALYAVNQDDERYKALEDWDKDTYYHIYLDTIFPGDVVDDVFGDSPKHFRIPKPFEVGAIFSTILERAMLNFSGTDENKHTQDAALRMITDTFAINPLGIQVIWPMLEQWANKNTFTDRPIIGIGDQGLSPPAQYDPMTSKPMRAVASFMHELFGDKAPETLTSPKRLEHLVQGYLGTIGGYALAASDGIYRLMEDGERPALRIDQMPVFKRFIQEEPASTTRYLTDFYDLRSKANETHRTLTKWRDEGQKDKAKDILDDERKSRLLKVRSRLNIIHNQLTLVRDARRQLYDNPRLTAQVKRDMDDILIERRNKVASNVQRLLRKVYNGS